MINFNMTNIVFIIIKNPTFSDDLRVFNWNVPQFRPICEISVTDVIRLAK